MLLPKSIVCLREGYSREALVRDLVAGVVVGIVALPLALAFAIASGVPPERGLYTAIVAGFLISALGGSRVQIGGPTGAFVVIVYATVTKYGYSGLVVCTLLAGCMLIALGLFKLGALIKFIPYPVVTGFTAGIAVIIASSQVKDLLGLPLASVPPDFVDKWRAYAGSFGSIDPATAGIAAATLAVLLIWPKLSGKVPAAFVAMVVATAVVQLAGLDVDTIGSRFGGISSTLPRPQFPQMSLEMVRELFAPAFTIALLAAIESLLSAMVADGMMGTRHNSNMELVGQGVANIASALFGGIPATGAIARTATNIRSGARTPVAGMTHALTLLAVLLALGKWAAMVPLAALAAILLVVSYHMSEWRSFASLMRAPKSDVLVLLTTFVLTVFVDLTVAVQIGVVLAALLFMKRMAEETHIAGFTEEAAEPAEAPGEITDFGRKKHVLGGRVLPEGVEVFELNGPFFFAVADKLRDVLARVVKPPRALVLRMRGVPVIDASGMHALDQLRERCAAQGTTVIFVGLRKQPLRAMVAAGQVRKFGRENFAGTLEKALERAQEVGNPAAGPD